MQDKEFKKIEKESDDVSASQSLAYKGLVREHLAAHGCVFKEPDQIKIREDWIERLLAGTDRKRFIENTKSYLLDWKDDASIYTTFEGKSYPAGTYWTGCIGQLIDVLVEGKERAADYEWLMEYCASMASDPILKSPIRFSPNLQQARDSKDNVIGWGLKDHVFEAVLSREPEAIKKLVELRLLIGDSIPLYWKPSQIESALRVREPIFSLIYESVRFIPLGHSDSFVDHLEDTLISTSPKVREDFLEGLIEYGQKHDADSPLFKVFKKRAEGHKNEGKDKLAKSIWAQCTALLEAGELKKIVANSSGVGFKPRL